MGTMKGFDRLLDRANLIAKLPPFACVDPSVASAVSGSGRSRERDLLMGRVALNRRLK